jgi:ADP-heptose:LPS heptosyltransferase
VKHFLVIRFHSLGDVILSTGIVSALAAPHGPADEVEVDVLTEERFLPVFQGHPHTKRLWAREELGRGKPALGYDAVFDLQGTPASRRIAGALGPVRHARHRALSRRWIVFWGDRQPRPRIPHVAARYAEACGLGGSSGGFIAPRGRADLPRESSPLAWAPLVHPTAEDEREADRLAPEALRDRRAPVVALLNGASRRTKGYPGFGRVAELLRNRGLRTWWFSDPSTEEDPEPRTSADRVFRLPLGPLKAVLSRADIAVCNDSGPMHLASALGVPVLALFGSTVTSFGFAPLGPHDRVLERPDLSCRPCGVHGRDHCWLGHWRCLREIEPDRVAAEAAAMLSARAERSVSTREGASDAR